MRRAVLVHIHVFVYKTLAKRNEIARKSRNYDKEMKMQIMNRQYASLYSILIKTSGSLIWVIDMGRLPG